MKKEIEAPPHEKRDPFARVNSARKRAHLRQEKEKRKECSRVLGRKETYFVAESTGKGASAAELQRNEDGGCGVQRGTINPLRKKKKLG